jgi:hypothetical protein
MGQSDRVVRDILSNDVFVLHAKGHVITASVKTFLGFMDKETFLQHVDAGRAKLMVFDDEEPQEAANAQ